MKLGIMQPYFMPYIGYFQLIKHTDRFILFDPVQFIRHGWIERNRILRPVEGWQYLSIPLIKQSRDALIKDTCINDNTNWRDKNMRQLEHYKKRSPYYNEAKTLIEEIFAYTNPSITHFNAHALKLICDYLNIPFRIEIFSEMNIPIDTPSAPDEWALNICKAIDDNVEYWNPIGGLEFFDRKKYKEANIPIKFLNSELEPYSQRRETFEPGLSILDVMMFNSPKDINLMLDKYTLL